MPRLDRTEGSFGLSVERLAVELARLVRLAELVEDGAFGRHQLPVRIFRRLRAAHGVQRRLELAGGGQRLAVGGQHVAILGIGDGQLAHHGERLVGCRRSSAARPRSCSRDRACRWGSRRRTGRARPWRCAARPPTWSRAACRRLRPIEPVVILLVPQPATPAASASMKAVVTSRFPRGVHRAVGRHRHPGLHSCARPLRGHLPSRRNILLTLTEG